MHLRRSHGRLEDYDDDDDHCKVNVCLSCTHSHLKGMFYFTLDNDNCEKSYEKTFKKIDFNPDHPDHCYNIVGSCNGLIFVCDNSDVDSNYTCNPITRECLYLPSIVNQSSGSRRRLMCMISEFGYLPSTNEYKVVRIYYWHGDKYFEGWVQVYTLGSGTGWRDKGRVNYSFQARRCFPAILANGALNWVDDEEKILAFHLADEEFQLLPSPPFVLDNDPEIYCTLVVLGGKLCAVHYNNDVSVDVWSLKKKEEKDGDYNMKMQNKYQFWSWIKEFNIDSNLEAQYPTPITITKPGQVLFYSEATLSSYDLKTANSEKLVDIEKDLSSCFCFKAIPHLNNFVSLKALGEEGTKTIESS